MFYTEEARARFHSRVDRSGGSDACHPWTHTKGNHGYGVASVGRKPAQLTHRLAYEESGREIPDGFHIDHECHNRSNCEGGRTCPHRLCCNPAHLVAKLPDANVKASPHSNHRKTHCPKGHEYTPENTRAQTRGRTTSRSCVTCAKANDWNPRRAQRQRERRALARQGRN